MKVDLIGYTKQEAEKRYPVRRVGKGWRAFEIDRNSDQRSAFIAGAEFSYALIEAAITPEQVKQTLCKEVLRHPFGNEYWYEEESLVKYLSKQGKKEDHHTLANKFQQALAENGKVYQEIIDKQTKRIGLLEESADLAQAELRAMYNRVGVSNSNALRNIDALLAQRETVVDKVDELKIIKPTIR